MLSKSSDPPARDLIVPLRQVVELLSPALGTEKSQALIAESARGLGFHADRLTLDHAMRILTALGSVSGVVGVAARFAQTRLLARSRKNSSGPRAALDAPTLPPEESPKREHSNQTIDAMAIAALLAHTIGTEKSEQLVQTAMADHFLAGPSLTEDQALGLLDSLAKAQGVVGIAARFAKARLILKFERN